MIRSFKRFTCWCLLWLTAQAQNAVSVELHPTQCDLLLLRENRISQGELIFESAIKIDREQEKVLYSQIEALIESRNSIPPSRASEVAALVSSYWSSIGVAHKVIRDSSGATLRLIIEPGEQTKENRFAKQYRESHGMFLVVDAADLLATTRQANFNRTFGVVLALAEILDFDPRRNRVLRHELRHSRTYSNLLNGVNSDYAGRLDAVRGKLFDQVIAGIRVTDTHTSTEELLNYSEDIRRELSAMANFNRWRSVMDGDPTDQQFLITHFNQLQWALDTARFFFQVLLENLVQARTAMEAGNFKIIGPTADRLRFGEHFSKVVLRFQTSNGNEVDLEMPIPNNERGSVFEYVNRRLSRMEALARLHKRQEEQATAVLRELLTELPIPPDLTRWMNKLMSIREIMKPPPKASYMRRVAP